MGLEGLMSKLKDRPYRPGRSPNWVKVKNRSHPALNRLMEVDDFVVVRPIESAGPVSKRAVLNSRELLVTYSAQSSRIILSTSSDLKLLPAGWLPS